MIDYILYFLAAVLIFGHLFSIFNIILGNYTSTLVRFFSVIPFDSKQLERMSKTQQEKLKSLVVLAGILHIVIILVVFGLSFLEVDSTIRFLCILAYSANTMIFSYLTRKLLESNS